MSASAAPVPSLLTEPFARPPGELELPYDDGEPLESARHRDQMTLLISSLQRAWHARDDYFVGGNMFVYFSSSQALKNDFRGPDVFVVLDTTRRERRSWVVWDEDGRTPTVVVEITSPSTEAVDRGVKMDLYAKRLHVPVYVLFDPFTGRLEGYELDAGRGAYRPLSPLANGDIPCEPLGLSLGVRQGPYEGAQIGWLRWIDAGGRALPTDRELAEAENERAEAEKIRAEAEKMRAEAEKMRADQLAARLSAYESRFGKLEP